MVFKDNGGVVGRIIGNGDGNVRLQDARSGFIMESMLTIRSDVSGRLAFNSDDLTSRNGEADGEMAKHDGSGTPDEGFYEWDAGDATWYGIGRVSGATI